MSEASDRGRSFEMQVQKITRQKLHLDVKRDSRSGAGIHKQDVRDRYNELPVFIECKDQQTTKLKEWWRESDAKSNYGQAPIVVFPDNEEMLCVMRYSDLLNFIKEMFDWKETAEDLRQPVETFIDPGQPGGDHTVVVKKQGNTVVSVDVKPAVERKVERGAHMCRNGHISDDYGYCMIVSCQYSRGYKKPKVKAKK